MVLASASIAATTLIEITGLTLRWEHQPRCLILLKLHMLINLLLILSLISVIQKPCVIIVTCVNGVVLLNIVIRVGVVLLVELEAQLLDLNAVLQWRLVVKAHRLSLLLQDVLRLLSLYHFGREATLILKF